MKITRCLVLFLLTLAMILVLSACGGQKTGTDQVVVEREINSQALKIANEANGIALRSYIYARLKTEEFSAIKIETMSYEELVTVIDELVLVWNTADTMSSVALEITEKALVLIDNSTVKKMTSYTGTDYHFATLEAKANDFLVAPISGNAGRTEDPETWAENLSKQYDALKGAQRYKQLAQQLGTDTKTAVEQMALAQKIIRNAADLEEAQAEVSAYSKSIKIVEGYKTASKVGLYIGATVATGGGSLTSLAGSSMTLGKAGGIIVGGVDCIVEVGATTSSIVLGEDHQVTLEYQKAAGVMQPLSMAIALVTLSPGETAEQIALVGESIMEWFNPGEITGIAIERTKTLGAKMIAQLIESASNDIPGIEKALKLLGLSLPTKKGISVLELTKSYTVNAQTALATIEELKVEIAKMDFDQITKSEEEGKPVEQQPVKININGLYQGTATVTAAKNDALGKVADMSFRITDNNNGTATLVINDNSVDGTYNAETREFVMEAGFLWNIIFKSEGGTIVAKGTMTSDETGQGFTQEVTLDLKKIGD